LRDADAGLSCNKMVRYAGQSDSKTVGLDNDTEPRFPGTAEYLINKGVGS
jgi:hypothetical protein